MKVLVLASLLAASSASAAVTLDDLVGAALSNNAGLRAAGLRVDSARAQAGQAASAWYPQVKGVANYSRTDNPPQAFFMNLNQRQASLQTDFNNPDDTENLRLGFSAGWLLFDGGQRALMQKMAGLGAEAQGLARDAFVNGLVHQVAQSYHGALQARDAVGVAAASVRSLEETLRLARERVNAGAAMRSDALNLEVKLAEARQREIQARNGLSLAVAALNAAIGTQRLTVADLDGSAVAKAATGPATQSVDARPELKAAQMMARIKQSAYRKARKAYSPTVSAFGEADWDSEVSADFEDSYLVGVAAEVELFDGSRKAKGAAMAKAEWDAAQADVDQARQQLELDLAQARLMLADATARGDVARAGIASAEEAHRLARERYQQGAADISEVMNAEVALAAARMSAMATGYEAAGAEWNLLRAQGLLSARATTLSKE